MSCSHAESAVAHLKRLKPWDGWSLEYRTTPIHSVRLLRRNVPVSDTYFLDLQVIDDGRVVGVLTEAKPQDRPAQGQVLTDARGNLLPRQDVSIVAVPRASPPTTLPRSDSNPARGLSLEEHQQVWSYAAYAVATAVVVRVLFSTLSSLLVLLLPGLYLYGVATCPAEESFDTKQQLKRVLRGHHLPDSHPDKPKGFLSETLARLQATVATELSTSLGYELTMVPLAGAAMVASVRVPSIERDFYWLGANRGWYYLCSTGMPNASERPVRSVQGVRRKLE